MNLINTGLDDDGLDYIHDEESVIKYSLTTLLIEKASATIEAVVRCLVGLKNLTHFQFDKNIEYLLKYFDFIRESKSDTDPEFKTNIFKSTAKNVPSERLTPEFLNWLTEKFPKVTHLVLFSLNKVVYTNLINSLTTSWKYITHLELSSSSWREDYHHCDVAFALSCCKENLIALKLESFIEVNIFHLGDDLRKLEKLSFTNCTFLNGWEVEIFENLRELEIILFRFCFSNSEEQDFLVKAAMQHDVLKSILSSKNIEKLFIFDQYFFNCNLLHDLIDMGYLKNLRELEVFFCSIRTCGFMPLIDETFLIKKIVVGSCPYIRVKDAKKILNIIKKKNLTISFLIANEIPYRPRWLLDLENPNK